MAILKDGTYVDTTGEHNKDQDIAVLELIEAGHVPDQLDLASLYDSKSKYTPHQKVKACAYYLVYGNSREVQRKTGLDAGLIRKWKQTAEWWRPTLAWLRTQRQEELDVQLTRIVHSAGEELQDRIQNGDWVLQKDGTQVRVPIKGKELAYIASIAYDKRALMRGDITSNPGSGKNQLEEIQKKLVQTIKQAQEKHVVSTQPAEIAQ